LVCQPGTAGWHESRGSLPRLSIYSGLAPGSRTNIAGLESTTGNPVIYLGSLCRMLVKVVFDVFAHRVAKPEIMRSSPVAI